MSSSSDGHSSNPPTNITTTSSLDHMNETSMETSPTSSSSTSLGAHSGTNFSTLDSSDAVPSTIHSSTNTLVPAGVTSTRSVDNLSEHPGVSSYYQTTDPPSAAFSSAGISSDLYGTSCSSTSSHHPGTDVTPVLSVAGARSDYSSHVLVAGSSAVDPSAPTVATDGRTKVTKDSSNVPWKCGNCGYEVPHASKQLRFCPGCGAFQQAAPVPALPTCPRCGIKALSSDANFCSACGTSYASTDTTNTPTSATTSTCSTELSTALSTTPTNESTSATVVTKPVQETAEPISWSETKEVEHDESMECDSSTAKAETSSKSKDHFSSRQVSSFNKERKHSEGDVMQTQPSTSEITSDPLDKDQSDVLNSRKRKERKHSEDDDMQTQPSTSEITSDNVHEDQSDVLNSKKCKERKHSENDVMQAQPSTSEIASDPLHEDQSDVLNSRKRNLRDDSIDVESSQLTRRRLGSVEDKKKCSEESRQGTSSSGQTDLSREKSYAGVIVKNGEQRTDASGKSKTKKNQSSGASVKSNPGRAGASPMSLRSHTSPNLTGLCKDSKNAVEVTFKIFLPVDLWSFDKKCFLHLRFGHPRLGNWQQSIGDFIPSGESNNGLQPMQCILNLALEVLQNPIVYKYYVLSSHLSNPDDGYEDLQEAKKYNKIVNRCLIVPEELRKSDGVFHQHDGLVLPRQQTATGLWDRMAKTVTQIFTRSKASTKLEVPSHKIAMEWALVEYLTKIKEHLLKCDLLNIPKLNFMKCVNNTYRIFHQLRYQSIVHGDIATENYMDKWNTILLDKVFINWLLEISQQLSGVNVESSLENGRKICSILVLLHLLWKIPDFKRKLISYGSIDCLSDMFGMLRMYPEESKSKQWSLNELKVLKNFIPQRSYKELSDCLVDCINTVHKVSNQKYLLRPEWLFVLPLVHIFKKAIEPVVEFNKSKEFSDSCWDHKYIDIPSVSTTFYRKPSNIEGLYQELKTLTYMDPYLLPHLLRVCPIRDLGSLFVHVPVQLSAKFLVIMINSIRMWAAFRLDATQVLQYEELLMILTRVMSSPDESVQWDFHKVHCDVEEFISVFLQVLPELSYTAHNNVKAFRASLCYRLHSLAKLCLLCTGNERSSSFEKDIDPILCKIEESLKWKWISKLYISNRWGQSREWCILQFLSAFDDLAKLSCPDVLQKNWLDILQKLFNEKINKIKDVNVLTECLNALETMGEAHVMISNGIFDAVIKGFSVKDSGKQLVSLYEKTNHKEIVSRILHNKLVDFLPPDTPSISIETLLQWDMWPLFISVHRNEEMRDGYDPSRSCLCEHCAVTCTMAYSTLDPFFERCLSGSITLGEINVSSKRKDRILELYSACHSSSKDGASELKIFSNTLTNRFEQACTFSKKKAIISIFCESIRRCTRDREPIEGLDQLQADIKKDYESSGINDLCIIDNDNVKLIQFSSCNKILPILGDFELLFKKFKNNFVGYFLKSVIKDLTKAKTSITIQNFVSIVWDPFFRRCCMFIDSLQDRSIKLSEVHEIEEKCTGHSELEYQLQVLFDGLQECHNRRLYRPKWIPDAVHQVKSYLSLCGQARAAEVVLQIKKKLMLTGNFDIVEHVASKVSATMRDHPLSSINTDVVTVASFLEEIATSEEKLKSIEMFSKCLDIVEWIRKEIDLQKFVSVALHTSAGEGDYSSDRLSNLKIVGSGYGPLIYKLKQTSSFDVFKSLCEEVWETLKQTPNLPTLLDYCNKDLEWYKSVKETQASVEVTSIGQMNNILKYGCYFIGSSTMKTYQNIHEVMSLSLQEKDQRLVKKQYNLEELRDLESKLVLITGSKADHRQQVDLFLDTLHSLCHIAEVLLNHQQIGNVQYTGWRLQVPCTANREIVDELQKLAKDMESKLDKWKECIATARKKYYELNYYTTIQLLALRQYLGVFKDGSREIVVPAKVLCLLQSIHPQVDNSIITKAVRIALSNTESSVAQTSLMASNFNEELDTSGISGSSMLAYSHTSDKSVGITQSITRPKLLKDDLSEQQLATIAYVTSRAGCSENLVLKALETLPDDSDIHDYAKWCSQNANLDNFSDDSSEADSDVISDSMEFILEDDNLSDAEMDYEQETKFHVVNIVKKHIPIQKVIDENHEIVQEVISAGYSKERSIEAVEKTRASNAASAIRYLQDQEENEDGLFAPLYQEQTLKQDSPSCADWTNSKEVTICWDKEAEKKYLSLEELGNTLKCLNSCLTGDSTRLKRPFPTSTLKEGFPNLLVLQSDMVLKGVLQLYMGDFDLPLPSLEEVLLCSTTTTVEEIELFWMRAIHDPGHCRIFSLVNAEELSNIVSDKALQSLSEVSQGHKGYRLVIFYGSDGDKDSHFISKLQNFRRAFMPESNIKGYQEYLTRHYYCQDHLKSTSAALVDHENLGVRVVTSERSGMGKSLYVQRMVECLQLNKSSTSDQLLATIPLHGPNISSDILMEFFKEHMHQPTCCIYHVDIASSVLGKATAVLFSLLVLRGISDSQGRVWRCHPDQLYVVETTVSDSKFDNKDVPEYLAMCLLNMLPSISCLSPCNAYERMKALHSNPSELVMDDAIFRSAPYQRVFQYLRRYTGGANLDSFQFNQTVEGTPQECLQMFLYHCGVKDPSWTEVRHFVKFLDLQLESCENSVFTDFSFVGDIMAGLKQFVVKFMMQMSRDFSTSSLKGEVAIENVEDSAPDDFLSMYEISERKRWEQSPHPYIFFNEDRVSITFVGFMVQMCGQYGDLVNPNNQQIMEKGFITKQLYEGLKVNKVDFQDNCRNWMKPSMIEKLATVLGVEYPYDPDPSYVLTVDNVIKILAIQMRFRCGIPVVIMGETGCGKTRLIRYMCDLLRQGKDTTNMLILKVHGGTTEKDIVDFLESAINTAEKNRLVMGLDTVVFFDEANTTDALGLIREIMCDRRINGKPVTADIKFIAACNPYRRHNDQMIERLENAGLGFFVKADESHQKLGKIPLRQLVYRVLDLPHSMRPLVYDFGQLNMDTERDYIGQIVQDHVKAHPDLSKHGNFCNAVATTLKTAQGYMRARDDECSFVSLRDVERAMIVFKYFFEKMDIFAPRMNKWACGNHRHIDNEEDDMETDEYTPPNQITRALILSISVCYRARLQDRKDFDEQIARCFINPISLSYGANQFREEIRWCEETLLDSMELGQNIARNAALRENVFMMAICVELRIPLFLVGKPGSSKSLAKAIITESMRGKESRSELLRSFKEVGIFSYQCSQLSTSESVIEVFKTAERFQAKQDKNSYVAVVVLDEVGLAEDSPNLPLKALHPLLEDGTEGRRAEEGDFSDLIIDQSQRVAFIGISNWALDPAKMNRGVMVTRADPSEDELVFSARGICSNNVNDAVRNELQPYFSQLAAAYLKICKLQEREFFGLRDFYSLIKMLYSMCKSAGCKLTWKQMEHAIKRNFGGLESADWNTFDEFCKCITMDRDIPNEDLSLECPDSSRLGLIRSSLTSSERNWHGENRYVLFLTENYAALDILKNPEYLSSGNSIAYDIKVDQPFILFGSSFPKDKEYTQVCRNINQIKICMETGRTVILLNLENLYESLYDVLNQYYIHHAGSRYVDLGLQTHRVRCRVASDFKLILIAEKDTVYSKFPTPLINRLEKHFILTSSILEDWQEAVLTSFTKWIKEFCRTGTFNEHDAFIGFQKDTPASVIFQSTSLLRRACSAANISVQQSASLHHRWLNLLKQSQLEISQCNAEETDPHLWHSAVLHLSQFLLLQTASPDSIFRVKRTPLHDVEEDIYNIYFQYQHHRSIQDFMSYLLNEADSSKGLLIQVTTHSHLLSNSDITEMSAALEIKGVPFSLHAFDTELDFSNKISPLFKKSKEHSEDRLIIIQCDSGHVNGDLIASARYRIYDICAKADKEQTTHVLFIIHLPRQVSSSLVGFQGEPWISAHIDDLRPTGKDMVELQDVLGGACISDLFIGRIGQSVNSNEIAISYDPQSSNNLISDEELSQQTKGEEFLGVDVPMLEVSENDTVMSTSKVDRWALVSDDAHVNVEPKNQEPMEITIEDIEEMSLDEHDEAKPEDMELPLEIDEQRFDEHQSQSQIEIAEHIRSPINHEQSLILRPESKSVIQNIATQVQFRNPLFRRLHRCIQPAASRLKDLTMKRSAKRVELLVRLIPKDIPNHFDKSQFHGILINHIYILILEREELYRSERNWIVEESMSSRSLLLGGTLTNALCRKADKVITQILAEIIAVVDRNCNLDLIEPGNENSPTSQFWLKMFSNFQIMQFKFSNFVKKDDPLPGTGARKYGSHYECKFPFSWLIYETFHGFWNSVKSAIESNKVSVKNQLCDLVKETDIGGILLSVDQYHVDEFYLKYLHDFVRIVHSFAQNVDEHSIRQFELLSESLDALLRSDEFCSIDGNISLIDKISSLHVVYQLHQSQVLWFGQLVMYNPGAMVMLRKDEVRNSQEMILHLCALEKALDCLALKMERNDETVNLLPWLCDLRVSQNIVTSIINMPSNDVLHSRLRLRWQILKVLQLFVDHVLLNHSSIPIFYLRRLQLILQGDADFSTDTTLVAVQKHLMVLEKDVKKKSKRYIQEGEMNVFLRNCCKYFMEVISTVCFGYDSVPKPELIKMLMQIIFTESKTRDLAPPFKTIKTDSKPTIRSSLLQLLLEYNSKDIKTHLDAYFKNSCQVLSQSSDNYLCLLCIQCFEDALYKSCYAKGFLRSTSNIYQIMETSYRGLCSFEENHEVSISYLEAVAGARFGLHAVAKLLHSHCCGSKISESISEPVLELFDLACVLCTDKNINVVDVSFDRDAVGPGIYLIKLLVKEYGLASLLEVSNIYKWTVPNYLVPAEQEKIIDPFVIYDELQYTSIRAVMKDAYIGKKLDELHQKSQDFSIKEVFALLLALYERITVDYCHPKVLLMDDNLRKAFDEYFASLKQITPPLRQVARRLLTNDQGGTLAQMKMTPQLPLSCKTLSTVVIHTNTVILCKSEFPILLPFVNMLMNPAALINAYLPTMSEDPLSEVRKAGGTFYTCPNGHEYFVGECGKPVQEAYCNVCRAPVGGQSHRLRSDNTNARLNDTTQTGHDLGNPNSRTGIVGSERYLSPSAICIMRAIMHSVFIWCSCHHEESLGDLARIVKPYVGPQFLPEFFWKHLECDIKQLSTTTGRNEDDATLLIHIVLKEILTKTPPAGGTITTVNSLMARNARQEWERIFCAHYITPVLEKIQLCLNDAIGLIAKDDDQGHDQLFYIVHEKVKVKSDSLEPHLWTYRQKISLQHLGLTLKEGKLKKLYPILYEFLVMEPKLRATQYLSDIVKLQQSLFDRFNYRMDRADAVSLKIKEFLQLLHNENLKNEYQQWIKSVQRAWEIVGHDLKTHGRKPVKEDVWIPSITLDTPIEYLIPTTTHAGVCTTSLVDFLTLTHNNFIEKCHSLVTGGDKSLEMKWLKNEVPITHIHRCHLLDYEHQIISVVLSHCHYSLKVGEAHSVKYDYQSLEKHILDKFIHGKPRILSDIPQVVFRKDIHSSSTFAAVREKVKPQIRLQSRVQKEILAELRTPAALQASLDVIDTILGFLSSGGGKPSKFLSSYIENVLKMQKRFFSRKAQELCQLKHILSLWETLSVELARLTWIRKQEPFHTVHEEQYHEDLTEDQKIALDGCLRVFDLNRLLGGIYEFIETSLRYQENLEWTLVDVLVQDLYCGLDLPEEFENQFPGDITIAQAVATWKHIIDYQENLKQL